MLTVEQMCMHGLCFKNKSATYLLEKGPKIAKDAL